MQRVSATEVAFRSILALIESDEVAVGDKLPGEIELAKRFGVSRSILREALGACAVLGLTETRTGSGTFIKSKTERPQLTFGGYSATHLMEARAHIEIPAAAFAAERHTPEQLEQLRELNRRMHEATDLHAWARLDGQFHSAIGAASANPVFESMISSMRQALDPQSEFLNITKARREVSNDEHERIVEAIASGSAEAASAAVAAHLGKVAEALTS